MKTLSVGLLGCVIALAVGLTVSAGPPVSRSKPEPAVEEPAKKVNVEEARERARLMHEIYLDTLEVMHKHYFRREGAVLPARALENIFSKVDRKAEITTRWIAVNTTAMSITHEPATEFEKRAARELATGQEEYSEVEKGYYMHAGSVPLKAGCVGCHTRLSNVESKTPKFAGLVIAIPVKE